MFHDKMVNWAKILNLLTLTAGTLLVHVNAMKVEVKTGFGRRWDSDTHERQFERELVARRAFNELQSRLPAAR